MGMRDRLIGAGFGVMKATKLHRLAAPMTRGTGAILMFHHVRPARDQAFQPNRLLEIVPGFLDAAIGSLRASGSDIVTMDEAARRLREADRRPFVVLTFDDGFRDNRDWALPVLEKHSAPAIVYVTTGFADRTARLWWVELEAGIRKASEIRLVIDGQRFEMPARTASEKQAAFDALYWRLRNGTEAQLLQVIADLCDANGVDRVALVEDLCLDWDEIVTLAAHPLISIGAHTMSHAMLAKHDEALVRSELAGARLQLEARLDRPVRHLAYPVGDRTSAAAREFGLAAETGYITGVTTRPGLIFPAHVEHLVALPRVSVNGNHQSLDSLEILLSGAAFTLWNRGRRIDAA